MDPIGAIVPWIAGCEAVTLIGATLLERFFPFLPSFGVLVIIGIAAAEGHVSVPTALALCTIGSVIGCIPAYAIGAALGETRAVRLLERSARAAGLSPAGVHWWMGRFKANEDSIAFGAQLVPTVRLIAPCISGLLRVSVWRFLGVTAVGASLWNVIFIGAGYTAAVNADGINASVVALKTLVALVVVEGLVVVVWRLNERRRATHQCSPRRESEKDEPGDYFRFIRAWIAAPLRIAAVVPSGRSLASLMTKEIDASSSPVIELGAGTGAFTRELIKRGIPESALILIESNSDFSQLLARRFPRAQVLSIDATQLGCSRLNSTIGAGAALSGLPLLSMPCGSVLAILESTFDRLRPNGALYQFTYGLRCPISRTVLDRLGLEADRIGGTLFNIPPASVYRVARRDQHEVSVSAERTFAADQPRGHK
ncbi:VTT domain-containing protein [Pleomorphomonas sp. NRK KF1]|uniref:VTT domain-containing protein n=1 Tax=Pleomorphomonas sp. NRK KF1 TaxID=2943000 RepID=UPI00204325B3|nr:VTT domain-containing protein [Pleomorphomonas sp. NRK KF1]